MKITRQKIMDFLKLYTTIMVFIFFLTLIINVSILKANPNKSCYEVIDYSKVIKYNEMSIYNNETQCTLITPDQNLQIKKSATRTGVIAAFCLVGIIIIGVFDKIKSGGFK